MMYSVIHVFVSVITGTGQSACGGMQLKFVYVYCTAQSRSFIYAALAYI